MPVLDNPKHELFAQELAKGKTQAEAYTAAGYQGDRTAASRLSTNSNIIGRVAELQANVAEKTETTTESLVTELEEARALAKETKQPSAMAQATIGKARLLGLIVEKKEDVTPRRSVAEIDARIRELVKREREDGAGRTSGRTGTAASGNENLPAIPGRGTAKAGAIH